MPLSLDKLQNAVPKNGLFGGGGWQWSPEPLALSQKEVREIESLGHPLAKFQQASDEIYRRSAKGRVAPWLADALDAGKPDWLVEIQSSSELADERPRIIRPDLIRGKNGFGASELDSVPGGIGITAWLSQLYSSGGYEVLGGANGMIEGFKSILPNGGDILVSDEAADYRPEMEWLVSEIAGDFTVQRAEDYEEKGRAIYRFFELFDWENIPNFKKLAEIANVTPPFKPHLEDKLWLAFLWSPSLQEVWKKSMRGSHLRRLRGLIPFGWPVDPTPLPPHAALPKLNVHSWDEVGNFSQKERELVLKVSGFHETAWGSRGVFIAHDLPADEWKERLTAAQSDYSTQPWIVQEFHEGRRFRHPIYREDGSVDEIDVRARLCPYYFTDVRGKTSLGGCLATLVPADKKKIHGMSDGILVPCVLEQED